MRVGDGNDQSRQLSDASIHRMTGLPAQTSVLPTATLFVHCTPPHGYSRHVGPPVRIAVGTPPQRSRWFVRPSACRRRGQGRRIRGVSPLMLRGTAMAKIVCVLYEDTVTG